MTKGEKKTVYEIVAEQIIEKLEAGVVPWRKPWNTAMNWESQRKYSGINALLLDSGEYATWNQIQKAGGKVKKGEKGHIVTFWKMVPRKTESDDSDNDGEDKAEGGRFPLFRYYKVWEINTQVEGLKSKRKPVEPHAHDAIAEAEALVDEYMDKPSIEFGGTRATYSPASDIVRVPEKHEFSNAEEFYNTLLYELVHSTGHSKRLKRFAAGAGAAAFGSKSYGKEELVAEIGAAMLCGVAGIESETIDNSAAYVGGWLRAIKGDPKMIVHAAGAAQKAADYIQGIKAD